MMKAETYFVKEIIPRLEKYQEALDVYYAAASPYRTQHTKFNHGNLTRNKQSFSNTIRLLSRLFPVIILRDENNLAEGLTIVGKTPFIDAFIEHFGSIILAVERDLEKITRPSQKLDKRINIISAINDELERFLSYVKYDSRSFHLLSLAKEYRQNISTLRIKKSYYGK